MENIIVYVDDADYAQQMLQPMLATGKPGNPVRWIVVACAPRLTHDASKWVSHSALQSWRGEWADKVFAELAPLLRHEGLTDTVVVTRLAETVLTSQTESLIKEFGEARVLDARRPRLGQDLQPVTAGQVQEHRGALGVAVALATAAVFVALD